MKPDDWDAANPMIRYPGTANTSENSHSTTRRSPGSSARNAATGIIAAVFDTSAERLFAHCVVRPSRVGILVVRSLPISPHWRSASFGPQFTSWLVRTSALYHSPLRIDIHLLPIATSVDPHICLLPCMVLLNMRTHNPMSGRKCYKPRVLH